MTPVDAPAVEAPCDGCHAAAHAEHATTRHAQAYTNPSFQAAWTAWPDPWCLNCHDPQTGVDCLDCHDRGGVVLSARPPSEAAESAHPIAVDPALGTATCLRCHQFNPPGSALPLQATGDEHAAWPGDASCAGCHLDGHALRGARDVDWVRDHLRARVVTRGGERVAVFDASGLGHPFPTGDPWRRLVITLLDDDQIVASWSLGRRVGGVGADFHLGADHRLPPPDRSGDSTLRVPLSDVPADTWQIRYLLVDPGHAGLPEGEAGYLLSEGPLSR